MSKHGGYHGLQHWMFFSENKWTSWSTMTSWDGRFFRHIQCPKIYTKPVTQKDTGGYSTMLRAKILHDFLNGALTISHLKLTQHCTSNLPQSSQHVKCNADCWSAFLNPTAWPLVVYRELLQSEITTGYSRCVVPCFWPGNNQTADHVGKKFMGKKSRMRLPWCFPRIFPIFTRFPNFLSTVGG